MIFKKIVKFLFYYMDPRFYQKIEIFEIQNFNKIPSFTIHFNFSSIFGILFCISPIQSCPKIMKFFVVFYWKGWDFTNDFCKILKVLLKKILICEIFLFFSKFCGLLFVFYFFIIFDILFSISSICTCQQILEIFMFFYFMDYRFYQRILENHGMFFKKI